MDSSSSKQVWELGRIEKHLKHSEESVAFLVPHSNGRMLFKNGTSWILTKLKKIIIKIKPSNNLSI